MIEFVDREPEPGPSRRVSVLDRALHLLRESPGQWAIIAPASSEAQYYTLRCKTDGDPGTYADIELQKERTEGAVRRTVVDIYARSVGDDVAELERLAELRAQRGRDRERRASNARRGRANSDRDRTTVRRLPAARRGPAMFRPGGGVA